MLTWSSSLGHTTRKYQVNEMHLNASAYWFSTESCKYCRFGSRLWCHCTVVANHFNRPSYFISINLEVLVIPRRMFKSVITLPTAPTRDLWFNKSRLFLPKNHYYFVDNPPFIIPRHSNKIAVQRSNLKFYIKTQYCKPRLTVFLYQEHPWYNQKALLDDLTWCRHPNPWNEMPCCKFTDHRCCLTNVNSPISDTGWN